MMKERKSEGRRRRRSGFTLVEVLLAVSISVIVFAAMGAVLTKCFSLWQDASAHWRLAQHARIARERILRGGFADPSGGLLCATNISITGTSSNPDVGYATAAGDYAVYIDADQMKLEDQSTTNWSWGVRSGNASPAPDIEVDSMTAARNGSLLTLAYRLRFSAAGKTFIQPHTIRAYLINER